MKRLLLTLSLTLATWLPAQASVATTWQHHLDAWSTHNLEAIMEDYGPDSVVIVRHHAYHGQEAIRGLFQALFRTFNRASEAAIDPATIDGKVVYITWHATIDGESHPVGTDTFVIEDGRITYQTVTNDDHFFELP